MQLRPVSFEYKETPGTRYGLIAEEVDAVDKTLVGYDEEGRPNSVRYTSIVPLLIDAVKEIASISETFRINLIAWLANAQNGITDFFAKRGHFQEELCVGSTCVNEQQFAALLASQNSLATPPPPANDNPNPSATLAVNGNNPAEWQLNALWQDNLGALFTHDGQSETIYSTSTVDVTAAGTTTIDYWAVVPSTQQVLHATRDVVVIGAANDNQPPDTAEQSTAVNE
jgi:hypothetical protein